MSGRPALHQRTLEPRAGDACRSIHFVHGIYGAGRNWRSVARRLVDAAEGWGAALVDLRMHGDSRGFSPPHTIEACASDLRRLFRRSELPPASLLGHSFGGKVVLQLLSRPGELPAAGAPPGSGLPGARGKAGAAGSAGGDAARTAWIVDSTPGAGTSDGRARRMLEAVRELPEAFGSREEAVEGLARRGFSRSVARWMTINLERVPSEGGFTYRWRLDWQAMDQLLESFHRVDRWDVVERPPEGWELHFVRAEDSSVLPEEECRRIEAAGRRSGAVHLHRVAGGHWLNADNPGALLELMLDRLPP